MLSRILSGVKLIYCDIFLFFCAFGFSIPSYVFRCLLAICKYCLANLPLDGFIYPYLPYILNSYLWWMMVMRRYENGDDLCPWELIKMPSPRQNQSLNCFSEQLLNIPWQVLTLLGNGWPSPAHAARRLKGQCHEIFCFWFFSWISFPPAPQYSS